MEETIYVARVRHKDTGIWGYLLPITYDMVHCNYGIVDETSKVVPDTYAVVKRGIDLFIKSNHIDRYILTIRVKL
tara:strand:- start:40560 stop:40784 length:225 start_codon:yes stop_codon:yes gene_type:complete